VVFCCSVFGLPVVRTESGGKLSYVDRLEANRWESRGLGGGQRGPFHGPGGGSISRVKTKKKHEKKKKKIAVHISGEPKPGCPRTGGESLDTTWSVTPFFLAGPASAVLLVIAPIRGAGGLTFGAACPPSLHSPNQKPFGVRSPQFQGLRFPGGDRTRPNTGGRK